MSTVLDLYGRQPLDALLCLAKSGASGIARYLVEQPRTDPRSLQPGEVQDAHAVGLAVHMVYEMSPTYAAYFTFDQGQQDARNALFHVRYLEAPKGSVVYFAVDAPPNVIPPAVLDPYFNGVEDILTNESAGEILPGIYGYEAHVEHARSSYALAKYPIGRHLWQTYGTPRGPLDLWQHLQETICGVSVDVNDCTVEGWKGTDMTEDQVKDIIRVMLGSDEGVALVKSATTAPTGYAHDLQGQLDRDYAPKVHGHPVTGTAT